MTFQACAIRHEKKTPDSRGAAKPGVKVALDPHPGSAEYEPSEG